MSEKSPAPAQQVPKQSFREAWADLERAARFRLVTLVAQLGFLGVAIIGFVVSSNGGSSIVMYVGFAGVIAMVALRLIASLSRFSK